MQESPSGDFAICTSAATVIRVRGEIEGLGEV